MSSPIISLDNAKGFEGCVLGYGHFTTIHPGHIRYLRHAKLQGEKLIVALKGDGSETEGQKFQFNQQERAEALALLSIADAVVLLDGNELVEAISKLQPSLLVLGKQFEIKPEPEVTESIQMLNKKGLSVMFHGGDITYATTDLLSTSE